MLFLDKLWEGNVSPGERRYHPQREYDKRLCKVEEYEKLVKAELSEEGKLTLDHFVDAWLAYGVLDEADKFMDGFRMGVLMMIDVFHPTQKEEGA